MANSYTEYTASSVTTSTQFATPSYITGRGATDISVTVGGVTQASSAYTLTGTNITFAADSLPTDGAKIRITRSTSQNARINTYSENTILTSAQLNTDGDQSFMMAQEAIDVAGETNLAAGTFYFSQANAPSTTVRGTLWYDLTATPNILKVYNGTEWEAAVPIHDTKVYKNAVNSSQGILAVSDASGLGLGSNYTDKSYITDTAFNSSGFVFLNGVKLVAGDAITDIAGGFGDYFHDAATNRVYFTDISNSDELVIETFSGSFSQEVTDKEAAAQVAKTAAEAAQTAAETAKTAAETAETNAAGHSSTASGHKDTATTQAGIATTKASEAATSASTATTKASEAATSASTAATKASEAATSASNASTSASNAASTLANAVTLNTSQTITGAKDFTGTVTADGFTVGSGNNELRITVSNSDTFFRQTTSTGNVFLDANNFVVRDQADQSYRINCGDSDGVVLYGSGSANRVETGTHTEGVLFKTGAEPNEETRAEITNSGLTVNGTVTADTATFSSSEQGNNLVVTTTSSGTSAAPDIVFVKDRSTAPIATEKLGNILFKAPDANNNATNITYGKIQVEVEDVDAGNSTYSGQIDFYPQDQTSLTTNNETVSMRVNETLFKVGNETKAKIDTNGIDVAGTVTADGVSLAYSKIAGFGTSTDRGNSHLGNALGNHFDLEIYHDGSNSYVRDFGSGNLVLQGTDVSIRDNSGNRRFYAADGASGSTQLYYGDSSSGSKLQTTNTGIDVTGTVTADGLTVDGSTTFNTGAIANGVLIEGTGGNTGLKIKTSETSTLASPDLTFTRTGNTTTPADQGGSSTNIGQIHFDANKTGGGQATYAEILGRATDYTSGAEDGSFLFRPSVNGTLTTVLGVDGSGIDVTGTVNSSSDIEVTDNTKGVILKSPNGSRFRLEVANDGTLSTEAL